MSLIGVKDPLSQVSSHIQKYKIKKVYPKFEDTFRAFEYFKESETKVVIVGQDPYPMGQANGLAFAVNKGIQIPKSLKNIIKEVKDSTGELHTDRTLLSWVDQKVLLLNSALTVEHARPNSHAVYWNNFIYNNLKRIAELTQNVVFMFWGKSAQVFEMAIFHTIEPNNHLTLKAAHPVLGDNGFNGCNHFNLANQFFEQNELNTIKW